MSQTILALACILAGTVLLCLDKSEALAGALLMAGAGVIGVKNHLDTKKAQKVAQDSFDATQKLRSDWMKKL